MDEKKITKEEFNEVVEQVVHEMVEDDKLEGIAKMLVPITGFIFASKMRKILFNEEKED